MIKKIGFVTAGVAAGMVMLSGFAAAEDVHVAGPGPFGTEDGGQFGLVNLSNTDVLHNVNVTVGACDNNVNVLGVQVVVEDALNSLDVPILSPSVNESENVTPENCASSSTADGGTFQND